MKSFYLDRTLSSYELAFLLFCTSFTLVMVTAYDRPDINILQWEECRLSVKLHQKTIPVQCSLSEDFQKTKNEFKELIREDSACIQFYDLQKSQKVNTDNLFINCFLSLQAKAIARSNQCFYRHYYSPSYIFCAKLETINDITFDIWNQCSEHIIKINQDVNVSKEENTDFVNLVNSSCIEETKDQILQKIFDTFQSKEIKACQSFYEYSKLDQLGFYINFENHYQECILSQIMLDIAQQDACFYRNYFIPMFIDCARLKL